MLIVKIPHCVRNPADQNQPLWVTTVWLRNVARDKLLNGKVTPPKIYNDVVPMTPEK